MWRTLIVFTSLLVLCYCQTQNHHGTYGVHYHKKKHHHRFYHHLLLKGLFTYLTFWAIKIKIIFVLGTIFTFMVIAGKIFAIIKYTEILKTKHDHAPEKVYIQAPSYEHGHAYESGPPAHFDSYGGDSFSSHSGGDVVLDHPPTGADFSSQYGYGRSNANSIYENYDMFLTMIRKLNITDMAFDSMELKSEECKRKFVCEADYNAKHSKILQIGFNLLSDENYTRYRTDKIVAALVECEKMYPNCTRTNT